MWNYIEDSKTIFRPAGAELGPRWKSVASVVCNGYSRQLQTVDSKTRANVIHMLIFTTMHMNHASMQNQCIVTVSSMLDQIWPVSFIDITFEDVVFFILKHFHVRGIESLLLASDFLHLGSSMSSHSLSAARSVGCVTFGETKIKLCCIRRCLS